MKTTLSLLVLICPSPSTLAIVALTTGLRAMPVADTAISLVEQPIPRNIVLADICINLRERPCKKWVQLEQPSFIDLEWLKGGTVAALRSAAARDDTARTKLLICTLRRFYLQNVQLNRLREVRDD
jgi:hypothetical protein